eukprot:GEMP01034045.1.p1 GENE.GEMP01034045.1~~GEMP01034045.1.p1  ORF type:complete len:479 (-),score=79.85 GEMP01034045.1:598-2034(-)
MKQFCTLITMLAQIRAMDIEDDSRDLTNNAQPDLAPTDGMADEVHRARRRLHIHESCNNAVLPAAMIQLQLMMLSLPPESQEELLNNFHLGVATSIMKPSMTLLQQELANPTEDIQKCQKALMYAYPGPSSIRLEDSKKLLSPLSAAVREWAARGGDTLRRHSRFRALIAGLRNIHQVWGNTVVGKFKMSKIDNFLSDIIRWTLKEVITIREGPPPVNPDDSQSVWQKNMLIDFTPQEQDVMCVDDSQNAWVQRSKKTIDAKIRDKWNKDTAVKHKTVQLAYPEMSKELLAPVNGTLNDLFELVGALMKPTIQSKLAQGLALHLAIKPMQTWGLVVSVHLRQLKILTELTLAEQRCLLSAFLGEEKCANDMRSGAIVIRVFGITRPPCRGGRRLQGGGFNGCALSTKKRGYRWPTWLTIVLAAVGGITAIVALALGIRRSARRRELQKELTKADEDLEQPEGGAHADKEGVKGNIAHL